MIRSILSILVVSLVLSACAQPNAGSLPTEPAFQMDAPTLALQASPAPTQAAGSNITVVTLTSATPPPERSGGPCGNPYYPVVDGATWVYDIEGLPQAVHTMSIEDEGKFKIAVVDVDSAAVLEGRCTADGIVLMEQGMEGSFFSESGSSSTSTLYNEGVTLPNDLKVGDAWSQVTGILADGADSDVSLSSRTITNYSVVGIESVTVPAGSFKALKIEQRATMEIYGKEIRTLGALWYVRGIGNVKTENGLEGGEKFLVQLVSYEIP